jgi:hypothetical protein
MSNSSKIPSMDTKHSGVPARLKDEADAAKERLYSLKTLPDNIPRKSNVRLPPDTSQEKFDTAIAALKKLLGNNGVELNDKPLVDGWYMEHPQDNPPLPRDVNKLTCHQ